MIAPLLADTDQRAEILVLVLPVAHELNLAGRAGLHLGAILEIKLPAIAGPGGVLDHRYDVDAEAGADEGHRRRLALDFEILNVFVRINFDEQIVDRVVQPLQRFLIHATARDVENNIDIDGIDRRLAKDRELCEGTGLNDLGDFNLRFVAKAPAQLRDEPVDLLV